MKFSTNVIIFFCYAFSFTIMSYAQNSDLKIKLILEKNEIPPLEPFYYTFEIENKGKEEFPIQYYHGEITTKLQYKSIEDTIWKYLYNIDMSESDIVARNGCIIWLKRPPISISKDSVHTFPVKCFMPTKIDSVKYLFKENNEYLVRLELSPAPESDTTVIYSDEIVLKIKSYEGEEKKAYDLLKREAYFSHFVYRISYQGIWEGLDTLQENIALELVEKYPNTKFGEWAALSLASHYIQKANRDKDLNNRLTLILKAESFAKKLLITKNKHLKKILKYYYYHIPEIKYYTNYYTYEKYFEEMKSLNSIFYQNKD